ncbi:LANO_0D06700g1_1 [Lachancea nothofagi CBS 11611]|uniref:LANO_0D06700g1_1 n=1 Tax=Lachancea nothofagi CBS 11611 TaxID=1266666 RepID=A0A1G4JHG1_9SACH|nr:LANO_0D06700g1_1 [Lachancea nothofagi CBS 11611]
MFLHRQVFRRLNSTFVPRHVFPDYRIALTDFKGHQMRAIQRFQQLLPQLNLLLELRDSRAPISTRNVIFDDLMVNRRGGNTKRLVLYTKSDLCPKETIEKLRVWHSELGDEFMTLDSRSARDVRNLIKILEWKYDQTIEQTLGHVEGNEGLPLGYRILVAGMPNVGKSTLVNTLRFVGAAKTHNLSESVHGSVSHKRRKVAKTGGQAGVTRATSECIRIADHRGGIYLYDTPGVSLPGRVTTREKMLSLSQCGCVKNNLVDPIIQADYLLYIMNLQNPAAYDQYTKGLPTNNVYKVLAGVGKATGIKDDNGAAIHWIDKWRQGARQTKQKISFDVETLLDDESFSYKDLVARELEQLGPWLSSVPQDGQKSAGQRLSKQALKAKNSNQLFNL